MPLFHFNFRGDGGTPGGEPSQYRCVEEAKTAALSECLAEIAGDQGAVPATGSFGIEGRDGQRNPLFELQHGGRYGDAGLTDQVADMAGRARTARGFSTEGAPATNATPTSDFVRHTTKQSCVGPRPESSKMKLSGKMATFGAVIPAPVSDKLWTMHGSVTGTLWNLILAGEFHSTRGVRYFGLRGIVLFLETGAFDSTNVGRALP